jgi:hypothetical protein
MRRYALLLVASVALAGCGGGSSSTPTTVETVQLPTTARAGDPGKEAVKALIGAAKSGDLDAMWGMASAESKKRVGPTLGEFKSGAGGELADSLSELGDYEVIVSERLTPEFGIVAVDDGDRVYALPLRLEGDTWKLELGSPVQIRPLGPLPGKTEAVVAQIGAAVEGPGGDVNVVMYLDGSTEQPQVRGTATNVTTFANFEPGLDPGRHTVVVAATEGRQAGATAWVFTVRKPVGTPGSTGG